MNANDETNNRAETISSSSMSSSILLSYLTKTVAQKSKPEKNKTLLLPSDSIEMHVQNAQENPPKKSLAKKRDFPSSSDIVNITPNLQDVDSLVAVSAQWKDEAKVDIISEKMRRRILDTPKSCGGSPNKPTQTLYNSSLKQVPSKSTAKKFSTGGREPDTGDGIPCQWKTLRLERPVDDQYNDTNTRDTRISFGRVDDSKNSLIMQNVDSPVLNVDEASVHEMGETTDFENTRRNVDEPSGKNQLVVESESDTLNRPTDQEVCFACWICFQVFSSCLSVKKHIVQGHHKGLCALAVQERGDAKRQPQLLLFCPKQCDFVTSELVAYSTHTSLCRQPALSRDDTSFEEIQRSFVATEFERVCRSGVSLKDLRRLSALTEDGVEQRTESVGQACCKGNESVNRDNDSPGKPQKHFNGNFGHAADAKKHYEDVSTCARDSNVDRLNDSTPHTYDLMSLTDDRMSYTDDRTSRTDNMTLHTDDRTSPTDDIMTTHTSEKTKHTNMARSIYNKNQKATGDLYNLGAETISQPEEKSFQCEECGKYFGESGQLLRHMKIHSDERPYVCGECGKAFYEVGHLLRHVKIHSGERPFQCEECDKSFTQSNDLQRHMLTHTGEKPYQCDECGNKFRQNSHLVAHMRTHTEDKPIKCLECEKSFNRVEDLEIHMRTHSVVKTYTCSECGKGFNWSRDLTMHMRTHTGERPFVCCYCSKSFHNSRYLHIHMRTHTGEKPFICNICGKGFSQNSNLVRHTRTHTGEKPFKCDACDKSFSQNSHLQTHKMKSHKEGQS